MSSEEPIQKTSKEEVLRLLDSEIHLLFEQGKKDDWNSLGVMGALGTVTLTLFNVVESNTIGWENTLTFLLILWLIVYSIVIGTEALRQRASFTEARLTLRSKKKRYDYVEIFNKPSGYAAFPLLVGLIWLAFTLSSGVPLYIRILAASTLTLLLGLFIVLYYLTRSSGLLSRSPKIHWAAIVFMLILAIAYTWSAYGYIGHLVSPTIYEFEVAGLIVIGMLLAGKLDRPSNTLSSQTLIRIRRQLVINEIAVGDALKQTEVILFGMAAGDVLRLEVEQLLDKADAVRRWVKDQEYILNEMLDCIRKAPRPIDLSSRNKIKELMGFYEKASNTYRKRRDLYERSMERLLKRLTSFALEAHSSETQCVFEAIKQTSMELSTNSELLKEKIREIENLLSQENIRINWTSQTLLPDFEH